MTELVAGSSMIRAMFEEGKKLAAIHGIENVYDFSLGNPNVEPPHQVKAAIKEILDDEAPTMVHGYMNNSGYEDVRQTIATYLNGLYQLELTHQHIVMTCGAAGGINILFKTLMNPNDEVVVFAPYFGEYRNYVNNFDGKLVVVPANIETFEPNFELMDDYITAQTKVVIVNSPNNPTGVIYSDKAYQRLAHLLLEKEKEYGTSIYLISDEPYRELIYSDIEVPYILKYYHNAIVGYSYSKSLSLPGERIGYLVVNPACDELNGILASLNVANRILGFVNAPSLFQRVIAKTLGAEVDVNYYKENRDLLYHHLTSLGFTCVKPEGAFYLFPRSPIADDIKFCSDAKQFNLLIVPGSAFGCPGHFRIAYCISHQRVKNSLDSFTKLWNLYNK